MAGMHEGHGEWGDRVGNTIRSEWQKGLPSGVGSVSFSNGDLFEVSANLDIAGPHPRFQGCVSGGENALQTRSVHFRAGGPGGLRVEAGPAVGTRDLCWDARGAEVCLCKPGGPKGDLWDDL